MWKKCLIDKTEYLIKHTISGALHKLLITDFIHLWFEEIQEDPLLKRCKEMNKLVEASDSVLLNLVWSLVEGEGDEVISTLSENNCGKQFSLQSNLDGLKFRIMFILTLADHNQFFEEVFCPLLTTISELEKRQSLLVDIIKNKDVEIAEYKLEGAKISRKAVETQLFDQEAFSQQCAKGLSTTKGSVLARPTSAFTPFLEDLLDGISAAPVVKSRETNLKSERFSHNNKKTTLKLRSPIKEKKSKLYDDEEDGATGEQNKEEENDVTEKVEPEKELKAKSPRGKSRPKVHKALYNL